MPDEIWPHSLRVSAAEWQALHQLRQDLQLRSPYGGAVSLRDAFRVAVGSTAAVIAAGGTPMINHPREAPPLRPTGDPTP